MANEKLGVVTEPSPESLLQWGFTFVQWHLTFCNLKKHHCASYSNLGVRLGALFQRGSAHQIATPPMVTELCGKTSACFSMQLTRKST